MGLELNIKPEDIERLVNDSIMQAGFGKAVTEAIKKALVGYNNPVDEAIKRYVGQVASDLIREKYAEEVRAAVAHPEDHTAVKKYAAKLTRERNAKSA